VQDNQHYPAAPATPPATARTTALICTIAGSIVTTVMIVADAFYWAGASSAQLGYQEHGAIIGLCAVLFIVGGIAWLIDAVARWLDDRAEHRQEVAQQREDERVDQLVNAVAGRLMAIEAHLPQALDEAHHQGYDRGWLHGSTGQQPETRAHNGSRTLRSV
jgi:uncharacterized membrane protein